MKRRLVLIIVLYWEKNIFNRAHLNPNIIVWARPPSFFQGSIPPDPLAQV